MKNWLCRISCILVLPFLGAGCATTELGKAATDIGLAGTGAVIGYQVSDGKTGPTAAGAVAGYFASKAIQGEYGRVLHEAEKSGYERALNQAVKQQYWIIQNQQTSSRDEDESGPRLVPVVIPEANINGVITNAHIEYMRIEQ